ncbi:siroheme synthase CysG [Methyloceanibacter caenitepidi]|uniref:Uroporphyrinogen-III methyltransferase n=1 Tax=Methyloceanibacter caenitepidi TaxID=1384459 RepID=A0A0A8K2Y3_9HYPH|nr:siroheme synthase CysG [Methyloceanibacter caenitepidi]BAQ16344.1 uroporphyrinogen-III methyltransferase [Methyloceanibacter caenitepidi]
MRTFPIFVRFDGKPPLVVGGGPLAAIKTRLLLKRADRVDVAAEGLNPELSSLEAEGKVVMQPAHPDMDQIRGRPLVISATEIEDEDARIAEIARALGVPVNVPDRPALCTAALPAIVDRGEVTVAIGTSAAAPVLAQRLRAWLENELHPRLGDLAELAGQFRERVAGSLAEGTGRRRLWEKIFDGPAAQAMLHGDEETARKLIDREIESAASAGNDAAHAPHGRVFLVGAGPGDPELLTMKAIRALKAADVVLYDKLVGDGVLELARREAELISVGKAKGAHSVPQPEINALLVARAKAGRTVVRLKGGDPFIFGRGGEELDALRAENIAVEVIPGVTAGAAAAASLQIPLTHRDVSHTVTFVSGHEAGGKAPSFEHLDLKALASGNNTLVVYMGVTTGAVIAQRLLEAGFREALPVIAVENASRPNERRVATTISTLANDADSLGLNSPAVLIFGEVAGLPAAGAVETILAHEEVARAYA